jgi:hypothetical protein
MVTLVCCRYLFIYFYISSICWLSINVNMLCNWLQHVMVGKELQGTMVAPTRSNKEKIILDWACLPNSLLLVFFLKIHCGTFWWYKTLIVIQEMLVTLQSQPWS